ncbi:hypothetical protein C6496_09140 [Candidatus Poribacteria bacterium]|nr:MAG: hypothetical protein C6496_09140 [Candidatus Poribacteria bacterium]
MRILLVMALFQFPLPTEFPYRFITRIFVVKITEPTAVFTEKEAVIFLFTSELVSRINADTIAVRAIRGPAVL